MEASFALFDFESSRKRMDEILDSSDAEYGNCDSVPSRDKLTFTNGHYVFASVIFVDIRGSKSLAESHTRPILAKIYRSFISETVAVLRSDANIHEIYIEGDAVWGVYDTPKKSDIDSVFSTAAQVASLTDTLNVKLRKKNYKEFKVGIGLAYGESLLIKAGYKGSGINEVVWIGKVVGEAAKLCDQGNRGWNARTVVSNVFYQNLSIEYKNILSKDYANDNYVGSVINIAMNEWVRNNG